MRVYRKWKYAARMEINSLIYLPVLSYRDRAKERRLKYGESDPPPPNRSRERFEQEIKTLQSRQKDSFGATAAMPISSTNVGSRLMQKMGWSEGQGLGKKNQGRTEIIEVGIDEGDEWQNMDNSMSMCIHRLMVVLTTWGWATTLAIWRLGTTTNPTSKR